MGKINKYANIYDKDGNLIRHVGDDGKLKNYTTEELEQLLDKLAEDKDENGNVKDPQALNNVNAMLFQYYQKYGNPHEKDFIQKLQEYQKSKSEGVTIVPKVDEETVKNALSEVADESVSGTDGSMKTLSEEDREALYDDMKKIALTERETSYEPEQYVDFEEIKEVA